MKENKKIIITVLLISAIVLVGISIAGAKLRNGHKLKVNNENVISSQVVVNIENNKKNNMEEKISKVGDVLVMNYTGQLENGKVFDSNVDPSFGHVEPFRFVLGAGQVIAGWDEGLIGMKIGEKKRLVLPPEKAYGNRTVGDIIPANSTLIFDVELVGIE